MFSSIEQGNQLIIINDINSIGLLLANDILDIAKDNGRDGDRDRVIADLLQQIQANNWALGVMPIVANGSVLGLISVILPSGFGKEEEFTIHRFLELLAIAILKNESEMLQNETNTFKIGVLQSITSAIIVMNEAGIIRLANNAWYEVIKHSETGLFIKAVLGSNYLDVLNAMIERGNNNALNIRKGIIAVLKRELPIYEYEYTLPYQDTKRYFKISVTFLEHIENCAVIRVDNFTEKKEIELALAKSQTKYKNLLDNMNDGFMVDDTDGKVLFANEKFCNFFGLQQPDLEKLNLEDYVAPEFHNMLRDRHNRRIAGEQVPEVFEYIGVRKDGKRIWLEANVKPVIENGLPIGTQSVIRDITERKKIEEELRRNEKRLKMAQEIAKLGSWEHDFITGITTWSDEMLDIYGLQQNDYLQSFESFLSFVHPEDIDHTLDAVNTMRQTLSSLSFFHRIFRADGMIKHLLIKTHYEFDQTKRPKRLIGICHDVTELKLKEIELVELAEVNRKIIDATDELFYVIKNHDRSPFNNQVVYLSKKANEVFGVAASEFTSGNARLFNFIHPEDLAHVKEIRQIVFATQQPAFHQYRIRNRSTGEYVWVFDYIKPILNPQGEIVELYGSIKNITALKNREFELERTAKDLNDKNNELMQFNYIVSHNLRAPVANILGMADIFKMPGISEEDKQICLEHIHSATIKMDDVIKDLNDILETRSAINKKKALVCIHEKLNSICGTLSREISETGTIINIALNESAVTIHTIKGYLESILYNLIANAIKFQAKDRPPIINITSYKINEQFVITIEDNGMGIDINRHKAHLFGLYKRFTTELEGKGLGLYMVKTQVETLGGTISVESELGKGTKFTIVLPE